MTKEFQESLSLFKDKISDCIKSNKSISITTHNDCDGLTSGSIITKALIREGAKCTIRTSKEFSKNVIQSLKTDSRDFHIITDLGGGFGKDLNQTLGDDWIILIITKFQMKKRKIKTSLIHGNMELMEA